MELPSSKPPPLPARRTTRSNQNVHEWDLPQPQPSQQQPQCANTQWDDWDSDAIEEAAQLQEVNNLAARKEAGVTKEEILRLQREEQVAPRVERAESSQSAQTAPPSLPQPTQSQSQPQPQPQPSGGPMFGRRRGQPQQQVEQTAQLQAITRSGSSNSIKMEQKKSKWDDDIVADIAEIPELDAAEDRSQMLTVDAPIITSGLVQTIGELNEQFRRELPSASNDGIDLSVLTSVLAPPEQVHEPDVVWDFDSVFSSLTFEHQNDEDLKEETARELVSSGAAGSDHSRVAD